MNMLAPILACIAFTAVVANAHTETSSCESRFVTHLTKNFVFSSIWTDKNRLDQVIADSTKQTSLINEFKGKKENIECSEKELIAVLEAQIEANKAALTAKMTEEQLTAAQNEKNKLTEEKEKVKQSIKDDSPTEEQTKKLAEIEENIAKVDETIEKLAPTKEWGWMTKTAMGLVGAVVLGSIMFVVMKTRN